MLEGFIRFFRGDTKRAYMAGFFDGEGYIGIERQAGYQNRHNPYYRLIMSITLTSLPILQLFQDTFGGSISFRTTQRGKERPSWIWRLWSIKALNCLVILRPYLILKKPEAELGVRFQSQRRKLHKSHPANEEELALRESQYTLMKNMKRR